MSIDTISDFLTSIRNALMVSKRSVVIPFSKMKLDIAKVLKEEGYIKDYQQIEKESGHKDLVIFLKYVQGRSAISEIKRISTPGRRSYIGINKMKRIDGGLGVAILSTNKGIITDSQARKFVVGGEVICHIR
ncbi:MAG: 30S ribosomal protein S8 [bacterium]